MSVKIMNLRDLCQKGADPSLIMAALRRRFNIATHRCPGQVYSWMLEASNDDGRVRLRLGYFFNASTWEWIYSIQKGDRP